MKEEIKSYYQDKQVKEKTKAHFEKHKTLYCCVGTGVVVAGVTALVCKSSITIKTKNLERNIMVKSNIDKSTTITNVTTVVNVDRPGPLSWMVECLETGARELSQRAMALADGISEDHLSEHLNGKRDHVNGLHYRRVGLAGASEFPQE